MTQMQQDRQSWSLALQWARTAVAQAACLAKAINAVHTTPVFRCWSGLRSSCHFTSSRQAAKPVQPPTFAATSPVSWCTNQHSCQAHLTEYPAC